MTTATTPVAPGGAPARDHAPAIASFEPGDFPVPTGREEEWRFTPLARLGGLLDDAPSDPPMATWEAAAGVEVRLIDRADSRLGSIAAPTDRALAQAWVAFTQAVALEVPADAEVEGVTTVRIEAPAGRSAGHVHLRVGARSRAVVVLRFVGAGAYAGTVEVDIADGADLTLISFQDGDKTAIHVGRQHARIGRDARLRSAVITLGGDVVRMLPTVEYAGPGGSAELLGLFFSDAGQHHEHRVFVDHAQPHCSSSVVYKGALQGEGTHSVWIGDVLVRPTAIGIDTYEMNRNLILGDGARADSVPNLELETGEVVGAGHASATGRFDDEQLFYLRARGIPESIARVLVVRGFFGDILGRIGDAALSGEVMARIDAALGLDRDALGEAGLDLLDGPA